MEIYGGLTYYISPTGSDANSGLSAAAPWLTPFHTPHCGDTVLAAAGSYDPNNFNPGKWGNVTCPANDNVAMIQCATAFACSVVGYGSVNYGAITIGASYWGVMGFLGNNSSAPYGSSFQAVPATATRTVHHYAYVNDIATGGALAGFSSAAYGGAVGPAAADYGIYIGDVAYNAATASTYCGSGFSIATPAMTDNNPGPHFYFYRNIGYLNFDGKNCGANIGAGTGATDGEALIFDTWNLYGFSGAGVAEGNLWLKNGNASFEVFPQSGTGASTAIYRFNTSYSNLADPQVCPYTLGDVLLNGHLYAQVYRNLSMTLPIAGVIDANGQKCGQFGQTPNDTFNVFNLMVSGGVSTKTMVDDNFVFGIEPTTPVGGVTELNAVNWDGGYACSGAARIPSPGGGNRNHLLCPGDVHGVNPAFPAPTIPGAPSCAGQPDTWSCYAATVAGFTPANATAQGYGAMAAVPQDQWNSTHFICNVLKWAPAALQRPCTPQD